MARYSFISTESYIPKIALALLTIAAMPMLTEAVDWAGYYRCVRACVPTPDWTYLACQAACAATFLTT